MERRKMTEQEMICKVDELCDKFQRECSYQDAMQIITGVMLSLVAQAIVGAETTQGRGRETKQNLLNYFDAFIKTIEGMEFSKKSVKCNKGS